MGLEPARVSLLVVEPERHSAPPSLNSRASKAPALRAAKRGEFFPQTDAKLVLRELAGLIPVPGVEPFGEALGELGMGELAVLVRVERFHECTFEDLAGTGRIQARAAAVSKAAHPKPFDGRARGFPRELVLHRLRASRHERLDGLGGLAVAASRIAHPGPEREPLDRFARDDFVEARQFRVRLVLHRGPDGSGQFVHLLREAAGRADGLVEFGQTGEVEFLEGLDFEDAFEETVLAAPGMLDAHGLALLLRARHRELPEGVVQVPGQELELVGDRMKIDVIVLPRAQDAVHRGEPDRDGHEARELLHVQKAAELRREVRVRRTGDQLREVEHAVLGVFGEVGLGIVDLVVFRGLLNRY